MLTGELKDSRNLAQDPPTRTKAFDQAPPPLFLPELSASHIDEHQLETRIALYVAKHTRVPKSDWTYRLNLVSLWILLTVALCCLFVVFNYQRFAGQTLASMSVMDASQNQSLTNLSTAVSNQQKTNVDQQAINRLTSANLEKTTKALAGLSSKAEGVDRRLLTTAQSNDNRFVTLTNRVAKLETALTPIPHHPLVVTNPQVPADFSIPIPLIKGAFPHTNAEGQVDYWVMPREDAKLPFPKLIKVLPLTVTSSGVRVHSIDDSQDFTISSTGEWLQK